jgi:hypothetical protein
MHIEVIDENTAQMNRIGLISYILTQLHYKSLQNRIKEPDYKGLHTRFHLTA